MQLPEAIDEQALDRLLRALGDATRRRLLDRLRDSPGLTLSALGEGFVLSRQAISKHLAVLAAAELVVTLWRGREKLHYLNPVPLQALPSRWVLADAHAHSAALLALQQARAGPPPPAGLSSHALARCLAQPLPPRLQAGLPDDAAALQAAMDYLAGTAELVGELRSAMAPRQGYAQPAGGGFSLVQHLWHLADVEQHGWSQRFDLLRQRAHAVLPGVDGDRLALEGRYQQRPWRGAAARFIRLRRLSLQALQRCDLAVLRRPVLFSGQPATGAEVLAAMLAHDQEHRNEMAALWPPSD